MSWFQSESLLYHAFTLPELKSICRERNLPVAGRKAQLVENLELMDLSDDELKMELDKYGISADGSKHYMVTRLIQAKRKDIHHGKHSYMYCKSVI